MTKIYVIGSLRNKQVPIVAQALREHGYDVFDDWYSAGPEADDKWLEHQKFKGLSYAEALAGPAARNVFEFDKRHLDQTDIALLVLPAGKSGHLELGYCAGSGKRTFVLFDGEPDRWDVMYQFATGVAFSLPELIGKIAKSNPKPNIPRGVPTEAFFALVGKPIGESFTFNGDVYEVSTNGLIGKRNKSVDAAGCNTKHNMCKMHTDERGRPYGRCSIPCACYPAPGLANNSFNTEASN